MINHFPLAGSGSGTYTKNLAVHLAQLGHEVCVILPENTDDFERVPGIRLRPVYFSPNDGAPGLGADAEDKAVNAANPAQTGAAMNCVESSVDVRQTSRDKPFDDIWLRSPGTSPADALPFNFPCFTTHPRSITAFGDLDGEQMAQYTRAFTSAIEEEIGANRPDVIHGQHVWILPALAAGRGIPLVLTAHGTDLMGYDKWPEMRHFAETAMDACSAVISISKDNCALLEEKFPQHADKIVMMRNGYDPGVFYPEEVTRDEVLDNYVAEHADSAVAVDADSNCAPVPDMGIEPGAWRDRRIVLFAGKLAHFKGVDVLLDAVSVIEKEHTNILVIIVGDGDERDALHAQVKELGLQTVRFLGNVDQQALRRLYNIADVSLVPSRREPFGLVAIEAMACGIPVIATNQGGLPDFVNDSVGALCEPEDAQDLARTILATLEREEHTDMPAWRKDIAHYARTHYAQDMIIKELESLYQKAI